MQHEGRDIQTFPIDTQNWDQRWENVEKEFIIYDKDTDSNLPIIPKKRPMIENPRYIAQSCSYALTITPLFI